jgi:hypothetical protein
MKKKKIIHKKEDEELKKINQYKKQLKKYLPLLTHIAVDKKNEKLVGKAKKPVVKIITDICKNCVHKSGTLNKRYKKDSNLGKCCDTLHFLATSNDLGKKKKILQNGKGLLSSILAFGIPALLELIRSK